MLFGEVIPVVIPIACGDREQATVGVAQRDPGAVVVALDGRDDAAAEPGGLLDGGFDIGDAEVHMPTGADLRVGSRFDRTSGQPRHGAAGMAQDHMIVFVGHLAAVGSFAGPVENFGVEDGRVEGISGTQLQPGRRFVPALTPVGNDPACPDAEGSAVTVCGKSGPAGTETQRADRDRGAALPNARCGRVRVVDGEVGANATATAKRPASAPMPATGAPSRNATENSSPSRVGPNSQPNTAP
jgi:hypothetical protein